MAASTDSNEGTEVLAYCGTCKMDLTAVVVAKVGTRIAKVLCKTCKKERAYKAPKGVTEPGMNPPPSAASKRKTKQAAEAPKSVSLEVEWQRQMDAAEKANRVRYTPKSKLTLGDVVQHPMFGDGIVMRIAYPDKAEILFKSDLKLLIHSRN